MGKLERNRTSSYKLWHISYNKMPEESGKLHIRKVLGSTTPRWLGGVGEPTNSQTG